MTAGLPWNSLVILYDVTCKKMNLTVSFIFRWDDDVVFKNCAKGVDEARKEKRFINDTLRSEFHKKFMEKYVK